MVTITIGQFLTAGAGAAACIGIGALGLVRAKYFQGRLEILEEEHKRLVEQNTRLIERVIEVSHV